MHTRSYTYNEITILQEAIKFKFNLNPRIYEKEEGQWVIYIPLQQSINLKKIVLPYIHYSFSYKIKLNKIKKSLNF